MPAIQSKLDTNSEAFQGNRQRMLELVAKLRELEKRTREKSAEAKPLFDKRGQLLPRERIARLLDAGAPWPPPAGVGWNSYDWYIPEPLRRNEISAN